MGESFAYMLPDFGENLGTRKGYQATELSSLVLQVPQQIRVLIMPHTDGNTVIEGDFRIIPSENILVKHQIGAYNLGNIQLGQRIDITV